ncbi:MAG: hypothetical protein HS111_12420 [Kofleriaceae bacterium]|nr:hypothetical protein [Kofleriaceae bacterium]
MSHDRRHRRLPRRGGGGRITGHLRAADAAARARLGLPADAAVILAGAGRARALTVSGTALRTDRDS